MNKPITSCWVLLSPLAETAQRCRIYIDTISDRKIASFRISKDILEIFFYDISKKYLFAMELVCHEKETIMIKKLA